MTDYSHSSLKSEKQSQRQTGPATWRPRFGTWLTTDRRIDASLWTRDSFLSRYALHLVVILVAVGAVLISGIDLPRLAPPPVAPAPVVPAGSETAIPIWPTPLQPGFLVLAPVPHTTIPERPRLEIITYTVQSGDSVFVIAQRFGISPQTIMWANGKLEDNPDLLRIGQELLILPTSGVYHVVAQGDTLESIAKKYKVDVAAITGYEVNHLQPPYELTEGQGLIVPGGEKPYVPKFVHRYTGPLPADAAIGSGHFVWPASGTITQRFWSHHRAIDIGGVKGSKVVAADSGFVSYAGWDDSGYGRMVLIDHGNGWTTLYAHLQIITVEFKQSVVRGQQIGTMGSTGNSTGPHLHFEIWERNSKRNPALLLP